MSRWEREGSYFEVMLIRVFCVKGLIKEEESHGGGGGGWGHGGGGGGGGGGWVRNTHIN